MKTIKINDRIISKESSGIPYLIAEAGVNHDGNMQFAKRMIEEVSLAGGDAIKFQAYKADALASKYSPAYWDIDKEPTKSQYDLFKKHDQFWTKEFEELAYYAKQKEIDFIATPFDLESVDFLEPLVSVYKIASADITCKYLLKYIAGKRKPIILSTGASSISEIWRAIEWIREENNDEIALLHCILNYPTSYKNAQLGMIKEMNALFGDYVIGYSDHTPSEFLNDVIVTSWLLGARIIEKHYTYNKALSGNDHYHAMDFEDLKCVKEKMLLIEQIIGNRSKNFLESELDSRKYARRSIVAQCTIKKDSKIKATDLACKRPGTGISPDMLDRLVGGTALVDIDEDEIISLDMVRFNNDQGHTA
jgi:sialic acid synthase SpsE